MFQALRYVRPAVTRLSVRPLSTVPTPPSTSANPPPATPAKFPEEFLNEVEENYDVSPSTLLQDAVAPAPTPVIEVPVVRTSSFINIPPAEDPLLRMFTSCIMQDGEREKASKTTSRVLLHLHGYTRQPPLEIFRQALFTAAPAVRNMRQKRGAKVLVKPIPLSEKQRMRKAIEWIWEVVNVRSKYATTGKTLAERTAREMIKILNGDSAVLRKKKEVHDMALANRGSVRGR